MTDRHPRADALPTANLDRIPQPGGRGAGSHELETNSDDPIVLRQVIERARERLTFYESFDRIIGENIRRSGELMLETIALREQAQAAEDARVAHEAAIELDRLTEREATRTLLASLREEVGAFQSATSSLVNRIDDALRGFEQQPAETATPNPAIVPESSSNPEQPEASPLPEVSANASSAAEPSAAPTPPASPQASFRPIRHATPKATPEPSPIPAEPATDRTPNYRTVDLVVNGIARATTALAFQRELGKKPGISRVETREFAEGVLRLSVEIADDEALSNEVFASWIGPGTISVVTRQPTLIAVDLAES
jgi:hypothetical protein